MQHSWLWGAVSLVLVVLLAGFGVPIVRAVLRRRDRSLDPYHPGRSGTLADGRVVEVSLTEEASLGGEYTPDDADPPRATYRVLLRYAPRGAAEQLADAEVQLGPRELDALRVDAVVPIRFHPARPGRVAVDPAWLRRVAAGTATERHPAT